MNSMNFLSILNRCIDVSMARVINEGSNEITIDVVMRREDFDNLMGCMPVQMPDNWDFQTRYIKYDRDRYLYTFVFFVKKDE